MRDAINSDEGRRLVEAMKAGAPWSEVRTMLSGVDPEALDRGWKEHVHREAGVELGLERGDPGPEGSSELELAGAPDVQVPVEAKPAKAPKLPRQPKAPKQPKPTPTT